MNSFREYIKDVYILNHDYAELWITKNTNPNVKVDYYYGGTRTVDYRYNDEEVFRVISYLESYESGLKNTLINEAIEAGVFESLNDSLPKGFITSRVGGGRCVIKPKNAEIADIITDITHPKHDEVVESLFEELGEFLNDLNGEVKLTPDFGRFAGLADKLHKFTPNVLGIACEDGGCGGKASYTSTGIIQAIKSLGFENMKDTPITLIGSEGACGVGVMNYLIENQYTNVAVCDLAYDYPDKYSHIAKPPENVLHLKSEKNRFTEECLSRQGLIITTCIGGELENSDYSVIKDGTVMLLAENEAIEAGEKGVIFINQLIQNKDITIIPGQFLTFGGALTSRVECFWRLSNPGIYFHKPLAHTVVELATEYWISKAIDQLEIEKNLYVFLYDYLYNSKSVVGSE